MEKKEVCIKDVIGMAKEVLRTTGSHNLQFLGVDKDNKVIMAMLLFRTDREKEMAVEMVRKLVKAHSIKKYWIIMEAWKSEIRKGEKLYRRAKRDINRIECLIVSEFNSDLGVACVCIPFNRVDDKIVFEKEQITQESHSIWNVYLEKKGIDERFDKDIKELNDAFIKKLAHNVSEKYKKEFFEAKTPEERIGVLRKVIADGKKAFDDQKKTILEDPDKED